MCSAERSMSRSLRRWRAGDHFDAGTSSEPIGAELDGTSANYGGLNPNTTINQIFAGMMPYMLIVILCMVIMYVWPGLPLWLPRYLYGG